MRLRIELALAALAATAAIACLAQPDEQALQDGAAPAPAAVEAALDEVRLDPNLVAERTISVLRWARGDSEENGDEPWWWQWANAVARWANGLFAWLAESGRYVVWVIGGLLIAALAVYLVQLVRGGRLPKVPKPSAPPSHVRDLDIRPESLPDDVGAAALALWRRGEQRAALALLYRAALSRLVHLHAVPIRASSTESECVALARPRVAEPGARYVARLVDTWAAAVYGGLTPPTGVFEALCQEFAGALDGGGA